MTDKPKSTFAQRVRAAKPRAKKYDVWDDVISGLGLRVGTKRARAHPLGHHRQRRNPDRARGAARGSRTPRHLHGPGEERQRTRDAGPPDRRLRYGVPRPLRPALEAEHAGEQRLGACRT